MNAATTNRHFATIASNANCLVKSSIALLAGASFLLAASWKAAAETVFSAVEMEPDAVIAVATPLRHRYGLVVIEQIAENQSCWSGKSSALPVAVELDLLGFDFTGICGRSTDSNGYSIRMAGEDLGLDYQLQLVERDGDILLVASPDNASLPELVVGKTHGISEGALRIVLDPGWRFTKRSYEGQTLGHYYFTHDQSPQEMAVKDEE